MNPNIAVAASTGRFLAAVLCSGLLFLAPGCSSSSSSYEGQSVFATPESAAAELETAVKTGTQVDLEAIFGFEARKTLSSGDPVADRRNREVVGVAMNQGWTLERPDADTRELIIGDERWPFPIPLVKDARGWWFDTAAGREEIWARRVGHNELATIRALRSYAKAQAEYAASGHDGRPAGEYAQRIRSTPGQHDGLYWHTTAGEPRSPFGEFASAALAEGYGAQDKEMAAPYHGYYYRMLTRQGPGAPGGEREYLVNGALTGGFAMIAYPAEYANSGIMTFTVGPDGTVYESDLGNSTATIVEQTTVFEPTADWRPSSERTPR